MPIGWFIAPYKRRTDPVRVRRYCAMDDFTDQVAAWSEVEVLGQHAIVKVSESSAVLSSIAGTAGFQRIPVARLDDPLSSLSVAQRNAIRIDETEEEVKDTGGQVFGWYLFNAASADDYLETNAVAMNSSIPQPARSVLTTPQKAALLAYTAMRRWGS